MRETFVRDFGREFFIIQLLINSGEDAIRDAFVRFVRPQPVKIAVSVVPKGERVRSRYKFEDYGNSAIRPAARVTSFPPDYLADGEGEGLCWQRVSFLHR